MGCTLLLDMHGVVLTRELAREGLMSEQLVTASRELFDRVCSGQSSGVRLHCNERMRETNAPLLKFLCVKTTPNKPTEQPGNVNHDLIDNQ